MPEDMGRIYLYRTRHLRSFYTQVDLTGNGQANEQPVIKAEIINELEHISNKQVN